MSATALAKPGIRDTEATGNPTIQNLLVEVQRWVDRNAWFLRAHLR